MNDNFGKDSKNIIANTNDVADESANFEAVAERIRRRRDAFVQRLVVTEAETVGQLKVGYFYAVSANSSSDGVGDENPEQ